MWVSVGKHGGNAQTRPPTKSRTEGGMPSLQDLLAQLDAEEEREEEVIDVPSMADILAGLDAQDMVDKPGSACSSTFAPSTTDPAGSLGEPEGLDNVVDEACGSPLPVVTREMYLAKMASAGKLEEAFPRPQVSETALAVIPSVETFLQRLARDAARTAEEERLEAARQHEKDLQEKQAQAFIGAPSPALSMPQRPAAQKRERQATHPGPPPRPAGSLAGLLRDPPPGHVGKGSLALGEKRPISLKGKAAKGGKGSKLGKGDGHSVFGVRSSTSSSSSSWPGAHN